MNDKMKNDTILLSQAVKLLGIKNKDHRRTLERRGVKILTINGRYAVRRADVEAVRDVVPVRTSRRPKVHKAKPVQEVQPAPVPAAAKRTTSPQAKMMAADFMWWLKTKKEAA